MMPCVNHGRPRELEISRADLSALGEYSCSIPTGKTLGKRWRRQLYWGTEMPEPEREWKMAEYLDCACCGPREVAIAWAWAIDPLTGEPYRGRIEL